jgi:hypothetical protein
MHALIQDFMLLFAGDMKAYGAYKLTGAVSETGKVEGKAYSLKGDVTAELWEKHLRGQQGLGIIPINQDSQVKFAAIDIDEYPLDLVDINRRIREYGLPLLVCRTKSGGAHLFLFLNEFAEAKAIQVRMREFASYLGFGSSEVFPKQTNILVERGDVGQWINMPYFDMNNTLRFGLNIDGTQLASAADFIIFAKNSQVSFADVMAIQLNVEESLSGGPPCLQHLIKLGFPAGTRNNGLFNLGIYAKKFCPDDWRKLVETYNVKYMDPPLTPNEVLAVIKSLDKKDYSYTCKSQPIQSHCNLSKCRSCKHGIGGGAGMPKLGTLTKLNTQPPIWFIDVEQGGRLELTTDDLLAPMRFQVRCMEVLNIVPPVLKRETWQEIVRNLLDNLTVVEVPKEATPEGQLMQHLEEFCTSRVSGKTHEELLLGKPWTNNKFHYFRLKDFIGYLTRQKFTDVKINRIAMFLRDHKAEKHFFNIKGKGCNCYAIPEFKQITSALDVPDVEKPEKF